MLGRPIQDWHELDSTNSKAQAWAAEGAPHGAVVLTEYQTHGRGQSGRVWQAAAGQNLLFSVILKPQLAPSKLSLLTLAGSLAVAEALSPIVAPLKVQVKWPNDVMIEGLKCCGILSESSIGPDILVIVGIGLNVNQSVFPSDITDRATSVLLATGRMTDRAAIMADILQRYEQHLALVEAQPSVLIQRCTDRLYRIGQLCRVRSGHDQVVHGRIAGLSGKGGLRLVTGHETTTLYMGELSQDVADA